VLDSGTWERCVVPEAESEAESEAFRCRCSHVRCKFRATREDLLCDPCRVDGHHHIEFKNFPGYDDGVAILLPTRLMSA